MTTTEVRLTDRDWILYLEWKEETRFQLPIPLTSLISPLNQPIWRSPVSHGEDSLGHLFHVEWKEETRFQLPIALTVQSRHSIIHLGSPFT